MEFFKETEWNKKVIRRNCLQIVRKAKNNKRWYSTLLTCVFLFIQLVNRLPSASMLNITLLKALLKIEIYSFFLRFYFYEIQKAYKRQIMIFKIKTHVWGSVSGLFFWLFLWFKKLIKWEFWFFHIFLAK